jgi:Ca-activated chloride channel family protein
MPARHIALVPLAILAVAVATLAQDHQPSFRSEVQLVNVTLTVTDAEGRFVPGLTQEDFTVYEDGEVQSVSLFSAERVPVSLGLALDASASMTSDKLRSARRALDRLVHDLLGKDDELFFLRFADDVAIVQGWTRDRRSISRAVETVRPSGGTAMYDAIAAALPTAEAGRHRKKAILLISDGNDTSSQIGPREVREQIRASDVLVYALGIDGSGDATPGTTRPPTRPPGFPVPFPGGRRPQSRLPPIAEPTVPWPGSTQARVNVDALRQLTDDTGGRTEVLRAYADLEAATARIAEELSRQYFLGYASTAAADGRWRAIAVTVRDQTLTVRARRGYVAS